MINKKHLLDSIKEEYPFISEDFYEMVKGFPEESEIDFDALWNEFNEICSKKDCDNCSSVKCAFDFLKSKHLSSQKPKQLPVKKTWMLKKEYYDFAIDMIQPISLMQTTDKEPKHKQYYDLTKTPDYSQVNVGDVLEIHHSLSNKPNYGIVQKNSNNILSITGNINSINAFCISYSQIKSLTILKAAE